MANVRPLASFLQLHHSPIVVVLAVEIVLLEPAFAIQRASALAAAQAAVVQLLIIHLKDVAIINHQIASGTVDELLAHHHFSIG